MLVVAHNCADDTAQAARDAGASAVCFNDTGAYGKGHALRFGFDRALAGGADTVLVIDADSVATPNLVTEVLLNSAGGAQAVQCRYEMVSEDNSPKGRLGALAFRAFTYIRGSGRSRLGLSAGISGNGFACEFAVAQSRSRTMRFPSLKIWSITFELLWPGSESTLLMTRRCSLTCQARLPETLTQQSRWQGGRLLVARSWLPALLRMVVKGNFRLLEPMLDLASLPIAFGAAALLLECLLPLHWARLYALVSLCIMAAHLTVAAAAGGNSLELASLLLHVPMYMLSKLKLVPKVLESSSSRAAWIRTDRQK